MTSLTLNSTRRILRIKNPVSLNYYENSFNLTDENTISSYMGFFVESGTVSFCVDNNEQILTPESFYILSPNTTFSCKNKTGDTVKFLTFSFSCGYNILKALAGCYVVDETEKTFIGHIIQEIKKQKRSLSCSKNREEPSYSFGAQQLIVSCIESLLVNLIRKKFATTPELLSTPDNNTSRKRCANEIQEYLRQNLYNAITLNDVKNHLFYSKTYLNNAFKKETGWSIISYYRILKIEEAKKLILNGEQITIISEKLKFDSPSNFYKTFKSVTGMTTSQFKKMQQL